MVQKKNKIIQFIINYGIIILTLLLMWYFVERKSYLYTILTFFIGFALWRLYLFRDNYKQTMQYIETMIWGKPLERKLWDKKELNNTKVKLVCGKKKK